VWERLRLNKKKRMITLRASASGENAIAGNYYYTYISHNIVRTTRAILKVCVCVCVCVWGSSSNLSSGLLLEWEQKNKSFNYSPRRGIVSYMLYTHR